MRTPGAAKPQSRKPDRMDIILVVNAGSSSVKFQVFSCAAEPKRVLKGQVEGIGAQPKLRVEAADKTVLVDESYAPDVIPDPGAALQKAASWLRETQKLHLVAVGHRVVHGGPDYDRPVLISSKVLTDLERFVPLAPLHQPNNLAPIRLLLARRPDLPQIACFDTAFHRQHSLLADHYAIPEHFYEEGVRRYGFHGLSYEYITEQLTQIAPDVVRRRVIVAHLGSGASMCAMTNGMSVENTLGFTALDGLPMGTRCGQIDPGVVLHLISERGMTAVQVQNLLYRDCGLKGLSGISNDVRVLEASREPRAAFALEYFVYRVGLYAGMLAASLGGLDAFVFTGGIGENSVSMRKRICERLRWLGAQLDPAANELHSTVISHPQSPLILYMIPTDEEWRIAQSTVALLAMKSGYGASRVNAV
jgi:acetate kinase